MRFVRRMEKLDDHFCGRTLEVSESLLKQYLGDKFFKMAKELLKGPPYMVTFPDMDKPEYRPLNELANSELIGTIMMQSDKESLSSSKIKSFISTRQKGVLIN